MVSAAQAGVIAAWNFSAGSSGVEDYAASSTASGISSAGLTAYVAQNTTASVTAGALHYTTTGTAQKYNNCDFVLSLTASGVSYSGLTASYSHSVSETTSLTGQWYYWNNSSQTWQSVGSAINLVSSSGSTIAANLTGLTLTSGHTLELMFSFAGGRGNNRPALTFDDVQIGAAGITPVPEPANAALGIFCGVIPIATVIRSRPIRDRVRRWRAAVVR
jgi:hypothetical protein